MQRRVFLRKIVFGLISSFTLITTGKQGRRTPYKKSEILIQQSPVAGFQFYEAEQLWPLLKNGDSVELIAEPDNRYDDNAVKIMWNNYQLGYLPRGENIPVSQMLNRQIVLSARIGELNESRNPWNRIRVDVVLC